MCLERYFYFPHLITSLLILAVINDPLRSQTFWALKGQAKCTVPEQLREDTHGPGHTEEDCVIVLLSETVMHKQASRMGVHIRPRVFGLSCRQQHIRHHLKDRPNNLEELVVW